MKSLSPQPPRRADRARARPLLPPARSPVWASTRAAPLPEHIPETRGLRDAPAAPSSATALSVLTPVGFVGVFVFLQTAWPLTLMKFVFVD